MNSRAIWVLGSILILILVGTVYAQGLYGSVPCQARNALEAYCVNRGGCPSGGYCYFPDGSSCELHSLYNGTCPGSAYYEQAIWMSEAYNFLYGDSAYSAPVALYQYPTYSNPSYYPNYYGPTYV
jgi:hypothetical protein